VGLTEVPCFVRDELDEEAAYMVLATANSQGELSPLERGFHADAACGSHGDTKKYAEMVGRPRSSVQLEKQAARVAKSCTCNFSDLQDKARHLSEIHSLPKECWKECAEYVVAQGLSVKETQERVNDGGEGAVVREPRAPYVAGRSDSALRWVPQDPAVNRRRVA
jgi:ParB-like chromosome segregation protein Spo0J